MKGAFISLVRGVLFDIGGVLLESANTEIRAVYATWIGSDPMALRQIFAREYPQVERGELSEAALQQMIQEHLGLTAPAPVADLDEAWRRGSRPVPAMFELARTLKDRGLPIGLLSNTQHSHVAMMRTMGFADLFDVVIYSCEVSARKPEPAIYRIGAEQLGLPAEQILFIDDMPANVEGARAAGLQAILHTDPAQTVPLVLQMAGINDLKQGSAAR